MERDVEQEVIPVSTGIYSENKLRERFEAIPKPVVVNYDDRNFEEIQLFSTRWQRWKRCH